MFKVKFKLQKLSLSKNCTPKVFLPSYCNSYLFHRNFCSCLHTITRRRYHKRGKTFLQTVKNKVKATTKQKIHFFCIQKLSLMKIHLSSHREANISFYNFFQSPLFANIMWEKEFFPPIRPLQSTSACVCVIHFSMEWNPHLNLFYRGTRKIKRWTMDFDMRPNEIVV